MNGSDIENKIKIKPRNKFNILFIKEYANLESANS
jgi:hypothetical protein